MAGAAQLERRARFPSHMVRLLAVVGAVLLVAAGGAHAEVRVARAPVGSIQFSGRAVAWDETKFEVRSAGDVEYVDRIVRRRPGHHAKVLAAPSGSFESDFGESDDDLRWDVSATALITGVGTTDYEASDVAQGARVQGGLLGQRSFTFAKCSDGASDTPPVSVWHAMAGYTNVCGGGRLLVRDLAQPQRDPLFRRDVADNEFDLAGNYVAIGNHYDPDAGIAVYDWRDGSLLYTVAADLWADEDRAGTFELQPDGKLAAVLVGRGDYCEAAWYTPDEPTAHVVGKTACGADIRLHSDRLAWMRIGKRSGALVVTPLGAAGRAVARFPAIPPRPRGELYSDATAEQSFAWDGRRLAYAVRRCDGRDTLLLRRSVGGAARRDRASLRCPLRLAARVLRVKHGAVRLPLRCPRGCAGTFDIRRSSTRTAGLDQPFAMGRRGTGRRLFLDDRTRATLAHKGTARMRVWIEVDGRLGGARHDVRLRLYGG